MAAIRDRVGHMGLKGWVDPMLAFQGSNLPTTVFTALRYSASDIGGMRFRWQINRSEAKEALTESSH
jgi:hypothetical protein